MRRLTAALLLCGVVWTADAGAPECAPPETLRLDHVPIAVADLAAAGRTFEALGFTLKPGRAHGNGLTNLHAKFADGTELELISAVRAVDAVTRGYMEFLRDGAGAAYLALHGGTLDEVEARLRPLAPELWRQPGMLGFPDSHRWRAYFFGLLNHSPTDRPEHYVHANGATALDAVWIGGDDAALELLASFGAVPCGAPIPGPPDRQGRAVPLAAGSSIRLLPLDARLHPDRPIVGVSVAVTELAVAAALLRRAGVEFAQRTLRGTKGLVIDPAVAPGLWIELIER